MPPKDNDTDPSTPGALRTPDPRPAAMGADTDPMPPKRDPLKSGTDPGVGPPSGQAAPKSKPMGVRVPGAKAGPHDSVDLLLDGITGAQPERTKTTPQTAGQASAAYHVEHPVRPAHTSPDDMPSVVVDRPHQTPTLRLERAQIQAAAASALEAMEPTVVRPPAMGPRVVVAVAAGLVVVMALFVVLKMTAGKPAAGADAPGMAAAAVATTTAATVSTATATATAAATASPTAAATSTQPAAMVAAPPAATAADPEAAHARPHPGASGHAKTKPAPSTTSTADLGEFKTTF